MLFGEKMIFSDESKFNIFNSDERNYVWRKSNTELDIQNVRPTVIQWDAWQLMYSIIQYSVQYNIQCSGKFSIDGININTIDKYKYYLHILKNNLKDSAYKLLEDFYF